MVHAIGLGLAEVLEEEARSQNLADESPLLGKLVKPRVREPQKSKFHLPSMELSFNLQPDASTLSGVNE